jgi:hypothetical protein
MKRDLELDLADTDRGGHRTSTLTKRLAHTSEDDAPASGTQAPRSGSGITRRSRRTDGGTVRDGSGRAGNGAQQSSPQPAPRPDAESPPAEDVKPAPDVAENDGMAQSPKRPSKPRNRRHGRRR